MAAYAELLLSPAIPAPSLLPGGNSSVKPRPGQRLEPGRLVSMSNNSMLGWRVASGACTTRSLAAHVAPTYSRRSAHVCHDATQKGHVSLTAGSLQRLGAQLRYSRRPQCLCCLRSRYPRHAGRCSGRVRAVAWVRTRDTSVAEPALGNEEHCQASKLGTRPDLRIFGRPDRPPASSANVNVNVLKLATQPTVSVRESQRLRATHRPPSVAVVCSTATRALGRLRARPP